MRTLDPDICYQAIETRDPRFDGLFFVGVVSTGIYCRTICHARRPKRSNCRFFANASLAEQAGFRPCKLCRPEQSPRQFVESDSSRVVAAAIHSIESGQLTDGSRFTELAEELGVSDRHLRRLFVEHVGVNPVQFAQTHRLLMAKRLLSETTLSITDVAMASGFQSVRRCNASFKTTYSMSPTDFRTRSKTSNNASSASGSIKLTLGYRPPYAWSQLMRYVQGRQIPGVEWITDQFYARTLTINDQAGWIRVSNAPERNSVEIEISAELIRCLPAVLVRVRHAFDLDASPSLIAEFLATDPRLAQSIELSPGLRLPGTLDPFETAVRTIVGQQVSVAAATTVMHRIVKAFGVSVTTPWQQLSLQTVTPESLAIQSVDTLAPLGLNAARARAILGLARAVSEGRIELSHSIDPERTIAQLQELDGIGPWTAHYFGMRILGYPDAFIASDLVIRKQFAPLSVKQIESHSQAWRPWRSYAVMHLWNAAGFFQSESAISKKPGKTPSATALRLLEKA